MGVTYYAAPSVSDKENTLLDILKEIKYYAKDLVTNGREMQEDFKEQGLVIGAVEAEGFLRCALQLESWLDGMTEEVK